MTLKEYNISVDQWSDAVYRFVLKNTRDKEWAEDIVQDAFAKLWENRKSVDSDKVKSWLFTTANRVLIDQVRRKQKQGEWTEAQEPSHSAGHYSGIEEVMQMALNKLNEIQKKVVLLRDYEGYDYTEIGEITGLSASQVKVYIFRARKVLKDYLVSVDKLI